MTTEGNGVEQINNLEDLSAYFYGLADGSIEPFNRMYGICHQEDVLFENGTISIEMMDNFPPISDYISSWRYFSGSLCYPVPSTDDRYPMAGDMFDYVIDNNGDMWVGEYGDLRKDLCRHIAKEIEKLIPVE